MEVVQGGRPPPPPPPSIIFEGRNLPQQTIYHSKGTLSKSLIRYIDINKYFDFATLWAIFAKWLGKGSTMAPEKNFKLLKYGNVCDLSFDPSVSPWLFQRHFYIFLFPFSIAPASGKEKRKRIWINEVYGWKEWYLRSNKMFFFLNLDLSYQRY